MQEVQAESRTDPGLWPRRMPRIMRHPGTLSVILLLVHGLAGCHSNSQTGNAPAPEPGYTTTSLSLLCADAGSPAPAEPARTAESLLDIYSQWQQAVPKLVHIAFHSPSPEQRNLARGALMSLIDTAQSPGRVREQLKKAYEQGDLTEKYVVLFLFGAMGPEASPSVPWLLREMRAGKMCFTTEDIAVFGHIGEHQTVVPELLRLCRESKDGQVQIDCLVALGELGAREAVPILLERLRSPQGLFRVVAARALGDIGAESPTVLRGLCASVQDPDEKVRVEAIASLGRLRAATDEVVAAMDAGLRDDSAAVREAAIVAVGRVGVADKKVLLRLCSIASDDVGARRRIRRTMSLLHGPSRARLASLFAEGNETVVQSVAAEALAISSSEGVEFLTEMIDPDTGWKAVVSVEALEHAQAFPDLVAAASVKTIKQLGMGMAWQALRSARMVEAVSPALLKTVSGFVADESVDPDTRTDGIVYLQQLGGTDPVALKALRAARDSTNQQVAEHAAAALKDMEQAGL